MATQQVILHAHEITALIASKAHQIGTYLQSTSPEKIAFDALTSEIARMHELTLELREKAAGTAKTSEEARAS